MRRPKILLVEDEFIVAFELNNALEKMGFKVCDTVSSGPAAIASAERERPDCALMDVSIKGEMDGIETARHLRARFGVRSVFTSGYPAEEIKTRAADVRPIGFFVKPLDYDALRAALSAFFLSEPRETD
jgi:DNA-binding NarL/FixJ family response regulator